jgi:hypothetical protein
MLKIDGVFLSPYGKFYPIDAMILSDYGIFLVVKGMFRSTLWNNS